MEYGKVWWNRPARYAREMWPHQHRDGNNRHCCWDAAYRAIFASNNQEAPEPTWEFKETIEIRRE